MNSPSRLFIPPASSPAGLRSPTCGAARQAGRNTDVSELWQRLGNATEQLMRSHGKLTLSTSIVLPNKSGIRCLDNDHVIKINRRSEGENKIHAHDLTLPVLDSLTTDRCYAAGQSPPVETYQDFLLQGIASGKGIFQFVSRKAHYDSRSSLETPIISMLEKAWLDPHRARPLFLGERYRIERFHQVAGRQAQHHGAPCRNSEKDYLRYQLVVTDTHAEEGENKTIVIPITQVGLKFTGKVLEADAIGRASQLLDAHLASLHTDGMPADPAEKDPLVVSQAGFGRNATLITYRNLKSRKLKGKQLDDALNEVIMIGRETRDRRFVHSEAQLASLREALEQVDSETRSDTPLSKPQPAGESALGTRLRESLLERRAPETLASTRNFPDELLCRAEYIKAVGNDPRLQLNDVQYLKFQELILGIFQADDPKPVGTFLDYLVAFADAEGVVEEQVDSSQIDPLNRGVEDAAGSGQHSTLPAPPTRILENQGTPLFSPTTPAAAQEISQPTPAVRQPRPHLPPRPLRAAQRISPPPPIVRQAAPANLLPAPLGSSHSKIQDALVAVRTLKEELEDTRRRQIDASTRRRNSRPLSAPRVDTLSPHIETLESMEHNLVLIEKCIPKPEDVSLTVDKYNLELACTILPKYFFDVSAIRIRVDADRKRLDYDTAAQGVFAMTRRVKANDIRPQVAQGLNNIVETCRNTNHKLSSAIRHIVVVHRRLQERGDNQAAIEVSATTSEMKSVLQLAKLDNDALRNAAIQQREDVNTMSVQDLQRLKISVDRDERLVARALEYATEMRYLAKHTIRETTKTIPSKSASAQGMEFAQTQRELVNEVARNVEAVLTQARQHKALLTIFMERTEPAGSATHNPRTLAADRSYYAIAGMARSKGIVSECVERLETSIHSVGILEKQLAIYKDLVDPNDIKHLSQLPQYRHVTNLEWHCRLQTVCRDLRDYFQEGLTAAITASLYIYGPATHRGEGFERVPRNRDIMRMTLDQRHEETRRAVKNVGDLMRDAKLVLQNIAPSREITKLFYLAEYLERESPKALAYLDTSIAKLLDSRKAKRSLASAVSKKKFEAMWASEGQHNLNSCNAVEYAWALNDSARYLRRVAHSLTHMPVRSLAATSTVAEQLPSATEPLDDMAPAAIG